MTSQEFRELLEMSEMTQERAAQVLGVTRGTISNYLNGKNIPSSKISAIRKAFQDSANGVEVSLGEGQDQLKYNKESIIRHIAENRDEYLNDPVFMSVVGLMEVAKLREENASIRFSLIELTKKYQEITKSLKIGQ